MNRASLAAISAISVLVALYPPRSLALNGTIQVERWTMTGSQSVPDPDPPHTNHTHYYFRREILAFNTDGSMSVQANYGIYDYKVNPGQLDDDSYAIGQRQALNGQLLIVDYVLDTDPDKASYIKASGSIMLDSTSDPVSWVVVSAAPSSATTAMNSAWNLLQSAYTGNVGNLPQLSQALIGWRGANFAGLSYNDQLQFALNASSYGLLSTNLREIEATLRASGFPLDLTQILPANGVDLAITSTPTYAINGSNVTLDSITLTNNRATQSGDVRLDVYAIPSTYLGGALDSNATLIASTTLSSRLDPGTSVATGPLNSNLLASLPNATYSVALMVSDGGPRTDHFVFGNPLQIGPIPGLPPSEQSMPTQLINISTRMWVDTGEGVAIGGFIVSGTGPKKVIIRALGPSLAALGVPGTLPANTLELHNSSGTLATNTGWTTASMTQQQAIMDSGLAPGDPRESAMVKTLNPGAYTAIVKGVGGQAGVALVEVYDLDRSNANVRPTNVSTRGRVLTSDNVMIGGFIIGGTRPRNVIVRAKGPSLASSGVGSPLGNPQLTLYDAAGHEMMSNDDWQNSDQAAAIAASGMQPSNPLESAIIMTLAPGPYTAIVRGAGGTIGIGLVEVFDLE